jgi:hypothetical protein
VGARDENAHRALRPYGLRRADLHRAATVRLGGVEALGLPRALPTILDLDRVVDRLHARDLTKRRSAPWRIEPLRAILRLVTRVRRKPRPVDLALLGVVGALVTVAAVDAVRSHRHAPPSRVRRARTAPPATAAVVRALQPAAAPARVSLHSSPDMAFLPNCGRDGMGLWIEPSGPRLVLVRSGPPCHLAQLRPQATVRDETGRLLYRGPALGRRGLGGVNLAGSQGISAPLLPGVLRCDVQKPVQIVVRGGGLVTGGAIHCRGSP